MSEYPTSPSANPDTGSEISLVQMANVGLRHRWLILGASLSMAFLVLLVAVLQSHSFTASALFMPQTGQEATSRVAGLASQLGVQIPAADAGQSPQFYADLVMSRELLTSAVESEYSLPASAHSDSTRLEGDLVELFGIEGESRGARVGSAVEVLRRRLSVATNPETGVVSLEVTVQRSQLAYQIANRILELVNRFNVDRRQTQASAEREFLEEQVATAEADLRAAEDSLETFLENNRRFESSPALRFRHDRLEQNVALKQQLFTSLSEAYQQARIDEVRNTPVVTVVGRPIVPPRPNSRRLILKVALGLLFGGLAALFVAFGRELVTTARKREPDHYAEFRRLTSETKRDLRRAWERLN